MAEDLPELRGRVSIDTSSLDRAVGKASRSGSLIGSAIGTVGGNLITKGLEVGSDALKTLSVDSINAASDLSETANKISTIFGPGAKALQDFASTADTKLGLSKQAALDAAATFGVFGKSAGLQGGKLTGFSKQLVGLSADLASFHNTSPEQAIDALGAALRGESEPMRAYGVLLDDASLKNEALRQGLIKTTKGSLTPQQKVLAAQALIMKQTSVAQGDFAKTSTGLANSQRIAKAQFANFQTQLGAGLLPVVNKIMGALVKFMPVLQRLGAAFSTWVGPAIDKVVTLVSGAFGSGGKVSTALSGLAGPMAALQSAFQSVVPIVVQVAQSIMGAIIPAVSGIVQVIVTNVLPAIMRLGAVLLPIAGWFLKAMGPVVVAIVTNIGNVVRNVFAVIGGIVRTVTAILSGDWEGAWTNIQATFSAVVSTLTSAVSGFFSIFGKVFSGGLSVAKALWDRIFGGLVRTASTKISAIVASVRTFFTGTIPGLFRSAGSVISSIWGSTMGKLITSVTTKGAEVVGWFRSLPGTIIGQLAGLGTALFSSGVNAIAGFINGIIDKAGEIAGVIREKVVGVLPDFVKDFLQIGSPSKLMASLGRWVPIGFAKGIASEADAPADALRRSLEAAVNVGGLDVPTPNVSGLSGARGAGFGTSAALASQPTSAKAIGEAVASALRGMGVVMDGRAVGELVNNRLGGQAQGLIRGGVA